MLSHNHSILINSVFFSCNWFYKFRCCLGFEYRKCNNYFGMNDFGINKKCSKDFYRSYCEVHQFYSEFHLDSKNIQCVPFLKSQLVSFSVKPEIRQKPQLRKWGNHFLTCPVHFWLISWYKNHAKRAIECWQPEARVQVIYYCCIGILHIKGR